MITKAQQQALLKIWQRWYRRQSTRRGDDERRDETYLAFRRRAINSYADGCLMIQVRAGFWYGIETDGYAHT